MMSYSLIALILSRQQSLYFICQFMARIEPFLCFRPLLTYLLLVLNFSIREDQRGREIKNVSKVARSLCSSH
jgi:hypothetical protein